MSGNLHLILTFRSSFWRCCSFASFLTLLVAVVFSGPGAFIFGLRCGAFVRCPYVRFCLPCFLLCQFWGARRVCPWSSSFWLACFVADVAVAPALCYSFRNYASTWRLPSCRLRWCASSLRFACCRRSGLPSPFSRSVCWGCCCCCPSPSAAVKPFCVCAVSAGYFSLALRGCGLLGFLSRCGGFSAACLVRILLDVLFGFFGLSR